MAFSLQLNLFFRSFFLFTTNYLHAHAYSVDGEIAVTTAATNNDDEDKATVVLADGTTIVLPPGTTATITADEATTGAADAESTGAAATEEAVTGGADGESTAAGTDAAEATTSADETEGASTEKSGNGHVTDVDVTISNETTSADDAVTTEANNGTDITTSETVTIGTNGFLLFPNRMVCARRPPWNEKPGVFFLCLPLHVLTLFLIFFHRTNHSILFVFYCRCR